MKANNLKLTAIAVLTIASLTGCGTMEVPYKPAQVGNLRDSQVIGDLEITLQPDRSVARIGDTVSFVVKIKNVGIRSVRVPAEPDIFLTWVYPDGKRDNFIDDPAAKRIDASSTVVLDPGDVLTLHSDVATYYFNDKGITEFRAMVSMDTPDLAGYRPAMHADIPSNGYGIMFNN